MEVQSHVGSRYRIVGSLVPFPCDVCGPGPTAAGSTSALSLPVGERWASGRSHRQEKTFPEAASDTLLEALLARTGYLSIFESVTSKEEIVFQTFLTMTHDTLPKIPWFASHALMHMYTCVPVAESRVSQQRLGSVSRAHRCTGGGGRAMVMPGPQMLDGP